MWFFKVSFCLNGLGLLVTFPNLESPLLTLKGLKTKMMNRNDFKNSLEMQF